MSKTYPHEPMNAIVQTISSPYGEVRMDCTDTGLTKREYFAAMAMQRLLTRFPKRHNGEVDLGVVESDRIAEESVIMADKLLKSLEEIK